MNMSDDATEVKLPGAERSTLRELLKIGEGIPEPEGVETQVGHWLYERYVNDSQGWKRRLYYALKPIIPRPVQIALRQRYVAVQAETTFPAWPDSSNTSGACRRSAASDRTNGSTSSGFTPNFDGSAVVFTSTRTSMTRPCCFARRSNSSASERLSRACTIVTHGARYFTLFD